MEIVLQWLDELDDLIFAGFSIWPRLRRFCLAVALVAALALHVLPDIGSGAETAIAALQVSVLSLLAWAIVAAVSLGADRSARAAAGSA